MDNPAAPPNPPAPAGATAISPLPGLGAYDAFRFPRLAPWANRFRPSRGCLNLRTTHDLRLLNLISGKLDVEDLDIDSWLTAEALECAST